MTSEEFSNQFDILYNNITSNQAPGLNEYEKSVFLTKAQNELVKNYFEKASKGNTTQKGYDDNAIRQMDFKDLTRVASQTKESIKPVMDSRAYVYKLPTDVFIIINEQMELSKNGAVAGLRTVVPLSYDEYMRLMSKPFKEPIKWQAWRLVTNTNDTKNNIEVILTSKDRRTYSDNIKYIVRYVKKPVPIILTDLSDSFGESLSIDGYIGSILPQDKNIDENTKAKYTNVDGCELDSSVHEAILQRAVELAKIAWGGDTNQAQLEVQTGQRSE